jgi:segregation and condensation protein A
MPTLQEDYQVTLDAFHGPLDLLLYLIRRAEVDIQDIPIATITDRYLDFLRRHQSIDIDVAGEFLVMAATLIEIKSRTIMPPEAAGGEESRAGEPGETIDPRQELVHQLLAYQRYRIAAEELDARRLAFASRFPLRPTRGRPDDPDDQIVELELEDVHVLDLSDAYERITAAIDFARLGDHTIAIDDTPIELHAEDLIDRLRRSQHGALTLQDAFTGCEAPQRIGMFLATLELARTRRVTVCQDRIEDPIELRLTEEDGTDDELTADE